MKRVPGPLHYLHCDITFFPRLKRPSSRSPPGSDNNPKLEREGRSVWTMRPRDSAGPERLE